MSLSRWVKSFPGKSWVFVCEEETRINLTRLDRVLQRYDSSKVGCCYYNMGLVARKPVFGVSSKVSFKPVSSATETSKKIEISPVSSLDMILSKKRITKALIRLRVCAGWSAPVLFANPQRQVFLLQGPYHVCSDFFSI